MLIPHGDNQHLHLLFLSYHYITGCCNSQKMYLCVLRDAKETSVSLDVFLFVCRHMHCAPFSCNTLLARLIVGLFLFVVHIISVGSLLV